MVWSKSEGPAVRNHFKARATPLTKDWQDLGSLVSKAAGTHTQLPGNMPEKTRVLSLTERKLRTIFISPRLSNTVISGSDAHSASTKPFLMA